MTRIYDGLGSRFMGTVQEVEPGQGYAKIAFRNCEVFTAVKLVRGRWFMAHNYEVSRATLDALNKASEEE